MISKKWEKVEKVRNKKDLFTGEPADAEAVVEKINYLIRTLFNDLKYGNFSAEGDTLRVTAQRKESGYEVGMSCRIRQATSRSYYPVAIYKNGRNTTVKWEDGTVTTVKRAEDTPDDEYSAFTAALAIKALGTNTAVKREIKAKTVLQKKAEKK